jgi:hypothetical protein
LLDQWGTRSHENTITNFVSSRQNESCTMLILEELMELLGDEQLVVRDSAFECFVNLLEFFGTEIRVEKMIPFLKKFCK